MNIVNASIVQLPEYTEFVFNDLIPTIRVSVPSPNLRLSYTFSSDAFNTSPLFRIIRNSTNEKFQKDTTIPANTPANAIVPGDTTTFTLTSSPTSKLKYQLVYSITIFPALDGYVISIINTQSSHVNDTPTNLPTNMINMNTIMNQINTQTNVPTNMINMNTIMSQINNMGTDSGTDSMAPRIIIEALNTTNGLEVSEINVEVIDVYNYTLCKNNLTQNQTNETTSSILEIYHPEFSDVILGCGCTFVEKLISLVGNYYHLYIPILVYAILKYVLALLIYGDQNLKYLYRSFNDQFLSDLKNSRFSNFYQVFTVPNLPIYDFTQTDKYFIWSKHADFENNYEHQDKYKNSCSCTKHKYNNHRIWSDCTKDYYYHNDKPVHRIWSDYTNDHNHKPVHRIWNQ